MKQKILKTLNIVFRPFFRGINFWPFNVYLVKFPIYKQIDIRYSRYFSRFYNFEQIADVKFLGNKWRMYCRGDRGYVEMQLIVGGQYEPEISRLIIDKLKDANLFLDIGANVGYYSILASKSGDKDLAILSFEPVRESRERFERNIALNSVGNVLVNGFALGNKNQEITISLKKELGHNSIMGTDNKDTGVKESIVINKFDDIPGYKFVGKKILVKIDTEGYEFEALKGMRGLLSSNLCNIIFEFTPKFYESFNEGINYAEDFLKYLRDLGFTLYEIGDRNLLLIDDLHGYALKNQRNQKNILALGY